MGRMFYYDMIIKWFERKIYRLYEIHKSTAIKAETQFAAFAFLGSAPLFSNSS